MEFWLPIWEGYDFQKLFGLQINYASKKDVTLQTFIDKS